MEAVAQGGRHACGRRLPGFAVGVVAQGQGFGLGDRAGLTLQGDLAGQAAGEFTEEAAPGAAAGVGLFVQQLLFALRQPMRLVAALEAQQVGEVLEDRVGQQFLGPGVVHLDPLQVEEDQVLVDGGAAFLGEGYQPAVGRLVGLAGVQQVGVDGRVVHGLVDVLQLRHGVAQGRRVQAGDLPAVALLEGGGALCHRVQVRHELRVVGVVVEDAEIPGHPVRATGRRHGRRTHPCSLACGRAVSVWLHYRRFARGACGGLGGVIGPGG